MYIPSPLNLEELELSQEMRSLIEELAKNVHENWAELRISEGWIYGEKRDDEKKTTPCLVPYGELPENEKEVDRRTAQETVKAIIALGYEIKKAEQLKKN